MPAEQARRAAAEQAHKETELAARRAEAESLKQEALQLQSTNLDDNLRVYTRLAQLEPDNAEWAKRRDQYSAKVDKRDQERRLAEQQIKYPERFLK